MIVLVRHAESVHPTPDGPDDYHRPLALCGLAQAADLVAELAALRPTSIASSPYLRAVQTVQPLADALGLPVLTDHALREWDSGLPPTPDWARHYAQSWADPTFARPGGESLNQLTARAVTALRSLATHAATAPGLLGGPVIVGSHGTFVSRALLAFGAPVDWPFSRAMPSPAIYRITEIGRAHV